jgi:hypothetical protein
VQVVVADDEAGEAGRAAEPGEPGKAQEGDRDHGQEQAQGDEDRQLAALDCLEAALHEHQQADTTAAFEFLATPGNLILDGRRAPSQRLEPSTSQNGLRGRSGAVLTRRLSPFMLPSRSAATGLPVVPAESSSGR